MKNSDMRASFFTWFFILVFVSLCSVSAQVEVNGLRPFYGVYVNKQISKKWSGDVFYLTALRDMNHTFWLASVNFGVSYRMNRLWTASIYYGQAHYNYGNARWWERHYPSITPTSFNTATFHVFSYRLKRDDFINRTIRVSNRIMVQHYFPKFEKYQTRFQYVLKLSYLKNKLFRIKPFVQGSLFYYLNGVPIDYFDENLDYLSTASPDGLHRYRLKFGVSYKPVKSLKIFIQPYFMMNREFNLNGLGNDIHSPRPSIPNGTKIFTNYPFNQYDVLGVQVNLFLD